MRLFGQKKDRSSKDHEVDEPVIPMSRAEAEAIKSLADQLREIKAQAQAEAVQEKDMQAKALELAQVEIKDPTAAHQYLRAAQEFISSDDRDPISYRTRIKLAIGYAAIGEVEEAIELIENSWVFANYDENGNEYDPEDLDFDEEVNLRQALAAVAYYSGLIEGISNTHDVRSYAIAHNKTTQEYMAHNLPIGVFKDNSEMWQSQMNNEYDMLLKKYKEFGLSIVRDEIEWRKNNDVSSDGGQVEISNTLYIDLLVGIATGSIEYIDKGEKG